MVRRHHGVHHPQGHPEHPGVEVQVAVEDKRKTRRNPGFFFVLAVEEVGTYERSVVVVSREPYIFREWEEFEFGLCIEAFKLTIPSVVPEIPFS